MSLFSVQALDSVVPTSRRAYLMIPVVAGATAGMGALLFSLGNSINLAQAAYMGFGGAFAGVFTGTIIAVNAVGNERAAYWRMRAEIEAHKPIPVDPNIDHDPKYYPELPAVQEVNGKVGYIDQVSEKFVNLKVLHKAKPANLHYAQMADTIARVDVKDKDTGSGRDRVNVTAGLWRLAKCGAADPAFEPSDKTCAGDGKLFSKPELHLLRDWMIENNLAMWKNPKAYRDGDEGKKARSAGWKPTSRARAIMKYLETLTTCPLPPTGRAGKTSKMLDMLACLPACGGVGE